MLRYLILLSVVLLVYHISLKVRPEKTGMFRATFPVTVSQPHTPASVARSRAAIAECKTGIRTSPTATLCDEKIVELVISQLLDGLKKSSINWHSLHANSKGLLLQGKVNVFIKINEIRTITCLRFIYLQIITKAHFLRRIYFFQFLLHWVTPWIVRVIASEQYLLNFRNNVDDRQG